MTDEMTEIEVLMGIPKYAWMLWFAGGAISTILGMWLLLNPKMTIGALVVLFGIGFVFNGLSDLAMAGEHPMPVLSYALSILFVVAGIVIIFNHSAGRQTLALVVGLSILITGVGDVVVAVLAREQVEHWLFVAFLGVIGVIVGIMALAWPTATLVVLAVLVGVRLLVSGLVHMGLGLRIRQELTA